MVGGVALGLYLGVWVMFLGGIVQGIEALKGDVSGIQLGIGILRVLLSPPVGWICGLMPFGLGATLLKVDSMK